jgi:hypothetical protein
LIYSLSNDDAVLRAEYFYDKFHLESEKWLKELEKSIENENFSTNIENTTISLRNIINEIKVNNISSFTDYNQNVTVFSPNPLIINFKGNLSINNTVTNFNFQKKIFFYSIIEKDNKKTPELSVKYKYKSVKKYSNLETENKTIEKKYILEAIGIFHEKIIPKLISYLEEKAIEELKKKHLEEKKKDDLEYQFSSMFGAGKGKINNTDFIGFCKKLQNNERIFCFKQGIVSGYKENIEGEDEFMKDEVFSKFSNLPNDNTAMYLNYKIFDDIIIEIGKSKQKKIELNNNNKFTELPLMNIKYLLNIFEDISLYYPLTNKFYISFTFENVSKIGNLKYKANISFESCIEENVDNFFEANINAEFLVFPDFDINRLDIGLKYFNITNIQIKKSLIKVRNKEKLKSITQEWIDISLKKRKNIFQTAINLMKYYTYIEKYENGIYGFFIRGRKNSHIS